DVAEDFCLSRYLLFEEALLLEDSITTAHVVLDPQYTRSVFSRRSMSGGNQTCAGMKQRTHAVPITFFSGGPGDHVVDSCNNRIHRIYVRTVGLWNIWRFAGLWFSHW